MRASSLLASTYSILFVVSSSTLSIAQAPVQAAAVLQVPHTAPSANTLLDGTTVKLRLAETMSSATAKVGQQVPFEVVEDVQVQGITVIPKGATALATVTDAEHKKSMGRGGKLEMNVDSVRLLNNQKVQLRATAGGKGGGHTGAMTGAMVATGIIFFPAAPLFLFIHGKDISLPKGLQTTAFVDGDMKLDLAAFNGSAVAAGGPMLASAGMSQVSIDASMPDSEISIDGAFAGTTPSSLALPTGKHDITVHKQGFTDWTRTLNVSGSAVRVHADLQQTQAASK